MTRAGFIRVGINPFTREPIEFLDSSQFSPKEGSWRGLRLACAPGAHLRSHFLGSPLLAPGTEWPQGPNGPLSFLACLDFAEVEAGAARSLDLPGGGVLNVFYDDEGADGSLDPDGPPHWKLIHETGDVEPLPPPAEAPTAVPFTLVHASLSGNDPPRHQLLGEPSWVQGDQRPWLHLATGKYRSDPTVLEALRKAGLEPDALMTSDHQALLRVGRALDAADVDPSILRPGVEQWQLLLQIDSDEALSFCWGGDGGTLYVLIPQRSLAARRFDDAWICMQCS